MWTCPFCGRSVPGRIDTCYCGSVRPKTPAGGRTSGKRGAGGAILKIAAAAAALIAVAAVAWLSSRREASTAGPQQTAQAPARHIADSAPPLESAIEAAMSSVVRVETAGTQGSGFFAAPDLVVTNAHLVPASAAARITVREGSSIDVKIVFLDVQRDLAFLQVPREHGTFQALPLGQSAAIGPGDTVVALGWTDSLAHVAATSSSVIAAPGTSGAGWLQAGAMPRDGDSGGPLLDRLGRVVGIVTVRSDTPSITLAIPIDEAKPYFAYLPANTSVTAGQK